MASMENALLQVFQGPEKGFKIHRMTLPIPGPGEILVRIDLATICGSDLHTIRGNRNQAVPAVLGHEGVGTILSMGIDQNRVKLGEGARVSWSLVDCCRKCAYCTDFEIPEKCEFLFKYGHTPLSEESHLNGCFASHILLRPGTHVVEIPQELEDDVVAPANCALATAINAVSVLPPCNNALVQGAGLLGLYTCAFLHHRGVNPVFCWDADEKRMELAKSFGATPLSGNTDQRRKQLQQFLPYGVDVVVEATGDAAVINEGVEQLRVGGQYLFVGMVHPRTALKITGQQIISKCLTLRGIHNYSPCHLDLALRFLKETATKYPYGLLVSAPYSLLHLDEAVEAAKAHSYLRIAVRNDET